MSNINLGIRVINVPESMPHQDRATELLRLPEFIRVDMATAAGLSLVNVGSETPALDLAALPWIRSNPDGSPAGIYVFYNGAWTRATPNTLESLVGNLTLLGGEVTITMDALATVEQTHDILTFNPVYLGVPTVLAQVTGGTILASGSYANWGHSVVATTDTLKIHTRCVDDLSASPQTVVFNWIALGVRDE